MKVGTMWYKEVISITFVNPRPIQTPVNIEAVNWDTLFPWMSAMFYVFANLTLMLALVAEPSMKVTFFPILAMEAIRRKYYGQARAVISIHKAIFRTNILINRHFLMSESKFWPYLPANRIAPSCPIPSFKTHWYAAAAILAYPIELPRATNRLCVLKNDMAIKATEPIFYTLMNLK